MILVVTGGCAGVADGRAVCQEREGLVVDILGPLRRGRLAIVSSGASVFAPDLLGYRVSASAGVSVGTEARRVRPGSRARRRRR